MPKKQTAMIPREEKNNFQLRFLPKVLIDLIGKRLKKNIKKENKSFSPNVEINTKIAAKTFAEISDFIDEKLYFRDWKYDMFFIADQEINSLLIDVYAIKKNLKIKLCVFSHRFDFRNSLSHDTFVTANDFMNRILIEFQDANRRIKKWNNFCIHHDFTFYDPPPVDTLFEIFNREFYDTVWFNAQENWGLYQDYGSNYLPITAFDSFNTMEQCTPLSYGRDAEWTLGSSLNGTATRGLMQFWITHKVFPDISFIVEEIKGEYHQRKRPPKTLDFFYYVMKCIKKSMIQWNVLVKENEIRGGVTRHEPIDYGKF
ncbi:MAG: hypothetical protein ACOCT9_02125 [archaeon]